jgi:hypothetical protein
VKPGQVRTYVTLFVGSSVALWAALLGVRGIPVTLDHLWPFTLVVSVQAALAGLVSAHLWRYRPINGWLVSRPDLRGTWKCDLISDGEDPMTRERQPPIACYAGVTQSLFRLNLHLMTPESNSDLLAHAIRPVRDSTGYEVAGLYRSRPDVHLRNKRSDIHLGALLLETHGPARLRPQRLEGEYWTDRKTRGTMKLFWCGAEVHYPLRGCGSRLRFPDQTRTVTLGIGTPYPGFLPLA